MLHHRGYANSRMLVCGGSNLIPPPRLVSRFVNGAIKLPHIALKQDPKQAARSLQAGSGVDALRLCVLCTFTILFIAACVFTNSLVLRSAAQGFNF